MLSEEGEAADDPASGEFGPPLRVMPLSADSPPCPVVDIVSHPKPRQNAVAYGRKRTLAKNVIIVGGGIVGLSTAMHLAQRFPDRSITVIEKEAALAQHQTGHNSGVVHAGVYYAPGSLKATLCKQGARSTLEFCQRHAIPYEQCGKLIVATDPIGMERLTVLYEQCRANALEPLILTAAELADREPRIAGKGAIFVAASGIVDYAAIASKMASLVAAAGGEVVTSEAVLDIREEKYEVIVETTAGTRRASNLVACGGLHADRLAMMCGIDLDFRIVPFRGEYFRLPPSKNNLVKHLIYPVPDPSLPFLGVHLTRMIGGYITVGPNAVLAFAKEGYRRSQLNFKEMAGLIAFPGFWKMLARHRRSAFGEFANSMSRKVFLEVCRKYCPELSLDDLLPYPAGVRAQAVLRDGTLAHDFLIRNTRRTLYVCNAPSPAATSALPIGSYLADRCTEVFTQN